MFADSFSLHVHRTNQFTRFLELTGDDEKKNHTRTLRQWKGERHYNNQPCFLTQRMKFFCMRKKGRGREGGGRKEGEEEEKGVGEAKKNTERKSDA